MWVTMVFTDPMDGDRETIVTEIKERIEKGEYRVDPQAVADAIVRRLREFGATGGPSNPCPNHTLKGQS